MTQIIDPASDLLAVDAELRRVVLYPQHLIFPDDRRGVRDQKLQCQLQAMRHDFQTKNAVWIQKRYGYRTHYVSHLLLAKLIKHVTEELRLRQKRRIKYGNGSIESVPLPGGKFKPRPPLQERVCTLTET